LRVFLALRVTYSTQKVCSKLRKISTARTSLTLITILLSRVRILANLTSMRVKARLLKSQRSSLPKMNDLIAAKKINDKKH